MFPGVKIRQTYGLSETGIIPAKSLSSSSLLIKVGDSEHETKVKEDILWIRTKYSMVGYLNAPDPFDDEGWFNTEDRVEQEGEYLKVLGRSSDLINVGGEKVYPVEVENCILQVDSVLSVVVLGKANPITGCIVIAHVQIGQDTDPETLADKIHAHCSKNLLPHQRPSYIKFSHLPFHNDRFKQVRGYQMQIPTQ